MVATALIILYSVSRVMTKTNESLRLEMINLLLKLNLLHKLKHLHNVEEFRGKTS